MENHKSNFTNDERRLLARLIKERPSIWDTTDSKYAKKNAAEEAWLEIAALIEKTAFECKSEWTGMCESYWYFEKAKEMLGELYPDDATDYELAEDMSFLPHNTQRRRASESFADNATPNFTAQNDCIYEIPMIPQPDPIQETAVLQRLEKLVEQQEKLLQELKAKESPYKEALASINWMLKRLPTDVAEETCEEISHMLLKKINKQRDKNGTKK